MTAAHGLPPPPPPSCLNLIATPVQVVASLAAAVCLLLLPGSEAAPAPQFPADLLVYAAIGKYIIGSGVGLGKIFPTL